VDRGEFLKQCGFAGVDGGHLLGHDPEHSNIEICLDGVHGIGCPGTYRSPQWPECDDEQGASSCFLSHPVLNRM